MSNVKEKILDAVTAMDDSEAEKVWDMIMSVLVMPGFEETVPFPDEIAAFAAARNGDLEYQPNFSQ